MMAMRSTAADGATRTKTIEITRTAMQRYEQNKELDDKYEDRRHREDRDEQRYEQIQELQDESSHQGRD